jgi:hypothetical protein
LSKPQWHDGSASVILLPGGSTGADLEVLIADWTKSWMLKPAFWIAEGQIQESPVGPPRIMARVTGRNGYREVDLFSQLSRLDIQSIRVIAARVVGPDEKLDRQQDLAVGVIEKYIEQSRPIVTRSGGSEVGIKILKVNLVFAPTEQKGASYVDLLESHWDVNLVVAPEDRATPTSFDGFTRHADKEKMNGFILLNIAATAGLWSGQQRSIFELENQFSDLSPIQNQVRVMRTFVRGILSEGLAIRVTAEALRRAGNATESSLDGLRTVPNPNLIAYEKHETSSIIDQMVQDTLEFQNGALKYEKVNLEVDVEQTASGVFARIRMFGRNSWSLIKVLPLWFFAALWNFIARAVTLTLFGARGREVAKGTIDFPKTDLDKDAATNLLEIKVRRERVKEVLVQWPRNTLRKSEPGLWADLRKIVLGRLDGSSLPVGLEHERDSVGLRVLGDLNQVLPSLHEKWKLPEDIQRTLDSDPRSANWQEMDVLSGIDEFLQTKIAAAQSEIDRVGIRSSELDDELSKLNEELQATSIEFEKSRISISNSDLNGGL